MTASTLLVTGATGCVGRAVVEVALRDGWNVLGLARSAPTIPLPEGVEFARADVRDATAVARAAAGCDAIVHAAGWVHRRPRSAADRAELWSSIVDGSRTVAAAASRTRLVVISSVAVHGRASNGELAPDTDYGRAKLAAETTAAAQHPQAVILRSALVYGPHDRGNFIALIRAVDRRLAFIVGPGTNRKSLVYAAHLADRVLAAARSDVAGAWIAADDPAPTQTEVLCEIARALGRHRPISLPRPLLATATGILDLVRGPSGAPRWRDRVAALCRDTAFSGAPLDTALGYRPRATLREAILAAVEWYEVTRAGSPGDRTRR